ncbi:hypothetical protein ANN_21786 [Periplaneta americana]|uniref:Mos1 transposase HTH domain-containing protein n=1 Tax=Periplaneta americana TaxID=6978 RepID=A0ABQ8S762_PERAM|nr:hypothetical protein ANN_21786 [Periplaneta americana]
MFKVIEHPADCEMRSVIRFLNARNIKPADIHRQLCEVYGDDAISDGMVRRWVRKFNEGRISVHDEQHTGRPSLISDDLVRAVDEKIHEDRRFTISSLSLNFPQMLRSGSQVGEFYNERIERLVPRLDKCLNNGGDYGVWLMKSDTFQDASSRAPGLSLHPLPVANYMGQSVPPISPRAKLIDTTHGKKLVVCNKEVPKNMLRAIRAVWVDKFSINKAAIMFGVSQSTLWRYVGLLPLCLGKTELTNFITYSVPSDDDHKITMCGAISHCFIPETATSILLFRNALSQKA